GTHEGRPRRSRRVPGRGWAVPAARNAVWTTIGDYRFADRTRLGTRFARDDVFEDGSSAYRLRHTMISVVSLSGSIRVSSRSIGYNAAPITLPVCLFLLSGCTTFIHIFRRAGRGESTGPSIRANAGRRRTSWNPDSSRIR